MTYTKSLDLIYFNQYNLSALNEQVNCAWSIWRTWFTTMGACVTWLIHDFLALITSVRRLRKMNDSYWGVYGGSNKTVGPLFFEHIIVKNENILFTKSSMWLCLTLNSLKYCIYTRYQIIGATLKLEPKTSNLLG